MLIYIMHSDKIISFKLPKKIDGSFVLTDFDSNGSKRNLITIESKNDKWFAISNNDVKIVENSKYIEEKELNLYSFYQLVLFGTEVIVIYVLPAYEKNQKLVGVGDNNSVFVGSDSSCDIVTSLSQIAAKQLELTQTPKGFFLKNLNPTLPVYVNKNRIDSCYLTNFDTIFIMGIKITIVSNNLLVNNSERLISYLSPRLVKPVSYFIANNYDSTGKVYRTYYDDKDYFSKSPVFQMKAEHYEITFADPPDISDKSSEKASVLMNVVPSGLMSITSLLSSYYVIQNYNHGKSDKETLVTSLVMCVIMLFVGVAWPFIQTGVEFVRQRLHYLKLKRYYVKYLKKKEKDIVQLVNKQKISLITNYLSLDECIDSVIRKNSNLYSRRIDSEDFLKIRLGLGNVLFDCNFVYTVPEFSMEDTSLFKKITDLVDKYKYINNVPVTISLKDHNILAFIDENMNKYDYIYALLMQILTLHGYDDLKIVTLTDKNGYDRFSFLRDANHSWNQDKSLRFFVDDIDTCQDVFNYLDKEFNSRKEKYSTYYLIITDCINTYRNQNIIDQILNSKENKGFSLVVFDSDMNNIPIQCEYFVSYSSSEGSIFQKEMNQDGIQKFVPEFINSNNNFHDIIKFSNIIDNIPLKLKSTDTNSLPTSLGFLEMYGVGNVSQLNSNIKWKEDSIINSLAAPIGVDSHNNLIYLDLHEKRHGPHGLIAGMTGSGKSEFIITYILSLAINYNPEEVQFVLIDYKGGGLAGAFENRMTGVKLPHLAGTITNLDKAEMNRTLVSIQSELQRRQKKFNEAKEKLNSGTIDIYKYQKLYREGKLDEPISHLFIICDEFAELKAQQPDFMDQLVSTARIGRSLGVHLILATQKPTGVVDEQIWSNSKFKVCCKVQTTEDSSEMIRKPDAAFLTDAGRFYLQVGYDQYFILGQSAYSGSKYVPSNKINTNIDNSIEFINSIGETIKTVESVDETKDSTVDYGEELTNILKYLIDVAAKLGVSAKKLWLDNIENNIYLSDVQKKYGDYYATERNIINPIIGEYDDPEHQNQGLVTLPLTLGGNCYICGDAGSGKTTLLSTILYSTVTTHSVDEVNVYVIDYGAESLKKFMSFPQVGDVITQENSQKVKVLFNRIKVEIKRRKDILSKIGVDYISYIKNSTIESLPNWMIIINGMDSFVEEFERLIDDEFNSIVRDSSKYGITFIVASISPNSLNYSTLSQFPQKVPLKFANVDNYSLLLDTKLVPSSNPGRGLIYIGDNYYQFQVVQIFKEEEFNDNFNYVMSTLNQKIPNGLSPIPDLPDFVTPALFESVDYKFNNVPVGINFETVLPAYFNFEDYINFIVSDSSFHLSKFINGLFEVIVKAGKVRAIVLSSDNSIRVKINDDVKYYNSDFQRIIPFLYQTYNKYGSDVHEERIPIFIIGYHLIEEELKNEKTDNPDLMTLTDLIIKCQDSKVFKFIFVSTEMSSREWDEQDWYNLYNSKHGIYVGSDFDMQEIIIAKKKNNEFGIELDNSNAVLVENSEKEFIRYIVG